jgi:glycerophosphoryl diester phosphodiesterase
VTAVIGHRGAPRVARENTVESFRAARSLGAEWVELDARLLPDGRVLVHHDPLGATVPEWVPTLAAALEACDGMGVNVEVKHEAGPAEAVADAVMAVVSAWAGPVLVSSFDRRVIDRVRAADGGGRIPTAWLTVGGWEPAEAVDVVLAGGHAALHPWYGSVTAELVALAHEAGVAVNTWTVDDPDRMRELASWGADGICTNVPDVAVAVLDGR